MVYVVSYGTLGKDSLVLFICKTKQTILKQKSVKIVVRLFYGAPNYFEHYLYSLRLLIYLSYLEWESPLVYRFMLLCT